MVLRQLAVGVDLDVEAAPGAAEEHGRDEHGDEDRPAVMSDPACVSTEHGVLLQAATRASALRR